MRPAGGAPGQPFTGDGLQWFVYSVKECCSPLSPLEDTSCREIHKFSWKMQIFLSYSTTENNRKCVILTALKLQTVADSIEYLS